MIEIVLLLALGLVLIGLEVFVPGGVLGLLGAASLIAGVVLAFDYYGTDAGLVTMIGSIVLVLVVIVVEVRVLARTRWGKSFFLRTNSTGRVLENEEDSKLVGKDARALTTLAPTGMVEIDGKSHEAFSQDGHVSKGESLVVRSADNFRIVVSRK